MRIEEFAVEEAWWGDAADGFAGRVENEFAWKVSAEELKARNWNLDCKNPHVGETVSHDPEELLREYAGMQAEIAALRDQLKGVLAEALERDAMSRLVTDHLPLLVGAPNGVKKLRELILELAVRGKLVAQNLDDEPADELLTRIAIKKSRLVIAGIVNKPKPSKNISNQELPFQLPKSWAWTRLGNLTELVTSGSRDWAKYYSESGAIFVRMGNLSKQSYELRLNNVQRVFPPKYEEGGRTKLEAGDLLISITGEVGLLGLVPENFGEAYINQHVSLVRFVLEARSRYFPEFLRSPFAYAQYEAPQRGVKNSFRLGDISELMVPVPPLAEQVRIVAKVDELMILCDQLKASLAQSQNLAEILAEALVKRATL
jgi:type I restriction enzyme S subunit